MFDISAEIVLPAPARLGGELTVRWPSDAEWIARLKARKFIQRRLGRGVTQTIPPKPSEVDLKVYEAISLNGTPALSMAEACQVLDAIGACSAISGKIEGMTATIELNLPTGVVTHHIKVPSAEQMNEYKLSSFKVLDLPFSQQEITYTPEAGGRIWDACDPKVEGYQGAVPVTHKAECIRAVGDLIDNNFGPRPDEANF
jgi:hypothetical protein